ncbi:DUF2092 domain-containing protein [Dyella humicola]|uniref:DUF2092 domain-containing protein n=1 Tax=Dyella humicola TaxID=2992126 RepID=UPI00224F37E2
MLDELNKMGAYLRTLNMFTLQVDTTLDEVLLSGQKLQFGGKLTYKYRKPNGLFLNLDTDRQQRQFFFDGKTFTLYSPRLHFYASTPAPATVKELLSDLKNKFGIELPISDLFLWGTDAANVSAIKSAIAVGPARINGAVCEHFAFRQEGVDWQLWVRQGDKPLPCRLVITTTDDDAKPQYAATFTWDASTPVPESAFSFTAPKDAHRIRFATTDATADTAKEPGHVQ